MEADRDDDGRDRDAEHVDVVLGVASTKAHLVEAKATNKEAASAREKVVSSEHVNLTTSDDSPQDEEAVGENGAQHRRLDDAKLALDESENRHNELDGVSKRSVEETMRKKTGQLSGYTCRSPAQLTRRGRHRRAWQALQSRIREERREE